MTRTQFDALTTSEKIAALTAIGGKLWEKTLSSGTQLRRVYMDGFAMWEAGARYRSKSADRQAEEALLKFWYDLTDEKFHTQGAGHPTAGIDAVAGVRYLLKEVEVVPGPVVADEAPADAGTITETQTYFGGISRGDGLQMSPAQGSMVQSGDRMYVVTEAVATGYTDYDGEYCETVTRTLRPATEAEVAAHAAADSTRLTIRRV